MISSTSHTIFKLLGLLILTLSLPAHNPITMAKQRNTAKVSPKKRDIGPPVPFKNPPEVLQPLIDTLDEQHVYIIHIDNKPVDFKRKIFIVPVLLNVAIFALFVWRMWYIMPWYLSLFISTLGFPNETTMYADEMSYEELFTEVATRAAQFMLDLVLYMFLWPWPVDFIFGKKHSSPVEWRRNVGFRQKEIIVRRSRKWDRGIRDVVNDQGGNSLFRAHVGMAIAPAYLHEKTGYLMMNAQWDLDWGVMIDATKMVDRKMAAMEAFRQVILVFQEEYGWMVLDIKTSENAQEDERRRQVLTFKEALAAVGKEDVFYRWIEIIQFESTQPGGFTPEKQAAAAEKVRELFKKEDIDFEEFWKESVGSDGLAGL